MKQPILLVEGEPIQWHRPSATYDKCWRCGGPVALISQRNRCCMGTCEGGGFTRTLRCSPELWLEDVGFGPDEVKALMKRGVAGRGNRKLRYVRPGFLGREE